MEFNANICDILEMEKSAIRPLWTYKLGENIISIAKEEKDLGEVIQDNLSPEKNIDKIFGGTFKMLRNIRIVFHFLDNTSMIRPKQEYLKGHKKILQKGI